MATTNPLGDDTSPFPTSTSSSTSPSSSMSADSGSTPGSETSNGSGAGTGNPGGAKAEELMSRVVQGAHETIDRLADYAAPHVQRLQSGVSGASDALQGRVDGIRSTGDEWAESMRTTVRDNPLAAVATALAVGMLIARLTR